MTDINQLNNIASALNIVANSGKIYDNNKLKQNNSTFIKKPQSITRKPLTTNT